MRLRFNRAEFARYCWPERFERPFNAFQLALLNVDDPPVAERTTPIRDAVAAPRGYAKSTIGSFVEVIHDIVYGLEHFIVIMSSGADLAGDLVEDVKLAFEDTEGPLVETYGPFVVEGTKTDFTVSVRGSKTIRVLAKSFGKQVRGIKHRGRRPSKIIVDDGEHSDRVRSPEQRAKTWRFMMSDVMKLGDKRTATKVRGTVLHPDAMLPTLLRSPGWSSSKWRAIITWPERADLWAECHRLWADLTDPDRRKTALAFYETHRAEMDRGAEVLDAIAEPLFACFEIIWSEGLSAFLREKQNEPRDATSALFDVERFKRCRVVGNTVVTADGRTVPFSELAFYGRLDPALGKDAGMPGDTGSGAGDFASIATLGRDRFGYGYLVDLWLRRARPDDQLRAVWDLHERFRYARFSIETNGFQALMGRDFRRMAEERRAAGKAWQLAVDEDTSSVPKDQRIATLEPPLANGWLQIGEIPAEGLNQFADFPTGDHDDGPDAVEGAWRLSRTPTSGVSTRLV